MTRWIRRTNGGETRDYRSEDGRFRIFPTFKTNPRSCRRYITGWILLDKLNVVEASGSLAECKAAVRRARELARARTIVYTRSTTDDNV
jgi:hypothetical protein